MTDAIETDATLPDVPAKAVKDAQLDGIKDAIAEGAKARFLATDGIESNDAPVGPQATYDVFQLQHLVDLDPEELEKTVNGKSDPVIPLSEGQIGGLLEVERSGKNRTDVVKVLMDRLGIDSPYEVTNAGPNYTNDVNRTAVNPRG